ncbi:MAG: HAMP domain-containing histidine kinase [Chloroflexi bacterium]|nr:HAMP domain-containing histidine kinase [Chloroflexota bacterium]
MSIRARLALWYGALLALVLSVALTATSVTHGDAHIAEVDAELDWIWDAAQAQVRAADAAAAPLRVVSLTVPGHDHGLSLVEMSSDRPIASAGDVPAPAPQQLRELPDGIHTAVADGVRVRIRVGAVDGIPGTRLVATTSLASLDESLARLRAFLVAVAAGGISVTLLGGWAIASGALRPIALLTETARTIAGGRASSRRLPAIRRRDELGELARTLNDMLARLETAYQLEQRFVSDTSHELRTPLTTVRGNAELLVQDDADPGERREAAGQILREATRLTRLIDELLALARADAETEPLDGQRVELDEVVMEAFGELRAQAGDRLRVVGLDEIHVLGDRDGLKQVVLILLDNALRYTPGDGRVEASVAIEDGTGVLRVDDSGIGIDPETEAHAFDRFYRSDAARRLAPEGTGLGLSIARWIVDRHGGSIELRPREPVGTSAVVRVPAYAGTDSLASARRSSNAFVTTVIDEADIASAPNSGRSSSPSEG